MKPLKQQLRQKFPLVLAVMILLVLLAPTSALAGAETYTISQSYPLDLVVFIPCANGGRGEFVELHGYLHDLFSITFNAGGGIHANIMDQPQGVTGYGLTTGAKYQGVGVSRYSFNSAAGFEEVSVNNFRMIGQGAGNNFLVHENLHITFHRDGTITSYHDNFSVACK